jgi:hypothetical protein
VAVDSGGRVVQKSLVDGGELSRHESSKCHVGGASGFQMEPSNGLRTVCFPYVKDHVITMCFEVVLELPHSINVDAFDGNDTAVGEICLLGSDGIDIASGVIPFGGVGDKPTFWICFQESAQENHSVALTALNAVGLSAHLFAFTYDGDGCLGRYESGEAGVSDGSGCLDMIPNCLCHVVIPTMAWVEIDHPSQLSDVLKFFLPAVELNPTLVKGQGTANGRMVADLGEGNGGMNTVEDGVGGWLGVARWSVVDLVILVRTS